MLVARRSELCIPVLGTGLRLCLQPLLRAGSSKGALRAILKRHLCLGVRTLLLLRGGCAETLRYYWGLIYSDSCEPN